MADIDDKVTKVASGTLTSLENPGKAEGATSIELTSAPNWPTDTAVYFFIRVVDANGNYAQGTLTEWKGVLTGTTVGDLQLVSGIDQAYPAAITTQVYIGLSPEWANEFMDAFLTEHKQDGSHSDINADTVETTGNATVGGALTVVSSISERGISLQTMMQKFAGGQNFFEEGTGVLSATGGLNWAISECWVWINGRRRHLAAQSGTAPASKDVYFDVHDDNNDGEATLVWTSGNQVANYAQAPALAANYVRLGLGRTDASTFVPYQQSSYELGAASTLRYSRGFDSIGNPIYPTDPRSKLRLYYHIGLAAPGQGASPSAVAHNLFSHLQKLGFKAIEGKRYLVTVRYGASAPTINDAEIIHYMGQGTTYNQSATSYTVFGHVQDTKRIAGRGYTIFEALDFLAPASDTYYLAATVVTNAGFTWNSGGDFGPAYVMVEEV